MSELMKTFRGTPRQRVIEVFNAYQKGLWEARDAGDNEPLEWMRIEHEIARQYDLLEEQREAIGNYASRVVEADIELLEAAGAESFYDKQ